MRKLISSMVLVSTILLSGCYVNLTGPAPQLSVPLTAESPREKGEATCTQLFWSFMFGDCSITAAMADGNIKQVHHVDGNLKMFFYGFYSQGTIKVYGE